MGKKKIALFYDTDTESGKQILEFLSPFAKRKSDIVGELILLWIAEHGTNVPVQWLDRSRRELGAVKPCFPKASGYDSDKVFENANETVDRKESSLPDAEGVREEEEKPEPDAALIRAGLASFF